MKNHHTLPGNISRAAFAIGVLVLSCSVATAQTAVAPKNADSPVPALVLPAPVAAASKGANPATGNEVFSLGLKWNESVRHFAVSVPNTGPSAVTVLGVQATGGLYVTSIPTTIPAKGTANLNLLFASDAGSSLSAGVVKLLTSAGLITVEVNADRAQVAQFSASTLTWEQGSAASAQTVTLTMNGGTAVPTGVKAMGTGNTATLSSLGSGKYAIQITPASTASVETFPVIVSFQPALPGVPGVIGCQIVP